MSLITILEASPHEVIVIDTVLEASRREIINGDNLLDFSVELDERLSRHVNEYNVIGLGKDYFDIAKFTRGQNGSNLPVADIECEHVSYRLNKPEYNKDYFTEIGTPTQILDKILEGTGFISGTVEFTEPLTYSIQQATSRRGLLMGYVALLGGEIEFDGFVVSILTQRGSTVPKDLMAGNNVTVISKSVDKRTLDENGNPTISYQCALENPVDLAIGDVVTLGYDRLDINVTLRIVSITKNPYNPQEVEFEVGNYVNSLEDSIYRIETSMVAKGVNYNGNRISAENGFESVRNDDKARTVMNATEGISVYSDTGEGLQRNFYVDTNGKLQAKEIVIDGDGNFKGTIYAENINTTNAKIAAAQIENLVVGTNVTMGPYATISWANVTDKPPVPDEYTDAQALSAWLASGYSTYITATGVYTGTVAADKIIGNQMTALQRLKIGINQNDSYSMVRLAAGPTWDAVIMSSRDIGPYLTIGYTGASTSDTTPPTNLESINLKANVVNMSSGLKVNGDLTVYGNTTGVKARYG